MARKKKQDIDKQTTVETVSSVVDKMESNNKDINTSEMVNILRMIPTEDVSRFMNSINSISKETLDAIAEEVDNIDLSNMTGKDIIMSEIKRWKLDSKLSGMKVLRWVIKHVSGILYDRKPTCLRVLRDASEALKIPMEKIIDDIKTIISKAEFINSIYIPILSNIPKKDITPEFLITEFIDYLYEDQE